MSPNHTKNEQKLEETLQPLWTVNDVAYYLNINPETVRVMVRKGALPARKIGRQIRFQQEDIKDWVKNQAVKNKT
jgi:excisionase family DNA binding protein